MKTLVIEIRVPDDFDSDDAMHTVNRAIEAAEYHYA